MLHGNSFLLLLWIWVGSWIWKINCMWTRRSKLNTWPSLISVIFFCFAQFEKQFAFVSSANFRSSLIGNYLESTFSIGGEVVLIRQLFALLVDLPTIVLSCNLHNNLSIEQIYLWSSAVSRFIHQLPFVSVLSFEFFRPGPRLARF